MKSKKLSKKNMKSKKLSSFFFVAVGILGSILLVFGLQFNGTLCDEIRKAGMIGIGIFALWGIVHLLDAYMRQRELENL